MMYFVLLIVGMLVGAAAVLVIGWQKWQRIEAQRRKQEQQTAQIRESLDEWKKRQESFDAKRQEFEQRIVSYKELQDENALLKQDLQNIDVNLRKLQLDTDLQREAQTKLDERGQELASRFLKDTIKWVGNSLNQNNYVASKQRIQDAISRCREIGFVISEADENRYFDDLKREYELMVRAAIEREEQARIKARIREEEQLKREVERELEQLERERLVIQAALERAMADVRGEHTEEIARLQERLAEAEAKAQRAKSQAEMTKAGHVYVISNIGTFGEEVFKIGMTRRLKPMDRIAELGDASVPFPFDVHMMISCDDAPTLENALHRALHRSRVNKVNPRKEYFRATIDEIKAIVEQNHGEVSYVADAEALQYRQSISMTDEEADYIEKVFEKASEKQDLGED